MTGPVIRRALGYLLFVLLIPGTGGVYVPGLILAGSGATFGHIAWPATVLVGAGVALVTWCFWVFLAAGRGTPAPWDAPRRVVAVGPYRWVRNPIYVGALMIVLGEAWFFLSVPLVLYAIAVAVGVHLLVVTYEEPALRAQFGDEYERYRRRVPRWIPRPPRTNTADRQR